MSSAEIDPTANLPYSEKLRLKRRNFEHWVRNILLGIACKLFGRKPTPIDAGEFDKSCKHVLIIRTGKAIGDAVMSTVLISGLRKRFPQCKIDLLLRNNLAGFFREMSEANKVLELHPKFLKSPLKVVQLLRELRSNGYDAVIVCDNPYKSSFTSLLLSLVAKTSHVIGFENEESKRFLTFSVKADRGILMTENLLKLISPFGKEDECILPKLKGAYDQAVANGVLIFIPNHWRKSSPLETFLKISERLAQQGIKVSLAFGPGDERYRSPEVQNVLKNSGQKVTHIPPTSLVEFVQSIRSHSLFISNDCGPYHTAVASGIPVVGLFLTKDAVIDFGYKSDRVKNIQDQGDEAVNVSNVVEATLSLIRVRQPV